MDIRGNREHNVKQNEAGYGKVHWNEEHKEISSNRV